jgi:hypothetical protein
MKKNWFYKLILLACLIMLPVTAGAADEGWGPGEDTWKFNLGAFFPAIDTSLRVDGVDLGDDIDLEDKLGFSDDDTIWRLDGYWRFFKKHRLSFGYHQFNRDGSATLQEELEIGDEVFPIGAQASSELNMGFYPIDYKYSYFQNDKWELSAGLGVYWIDLEFSVSATVQAGEDPPEKIFESSDFNGPLPYLALAFEYYITPQWLTVFKGGYFALEVGDVDGSLANFGAQIEYQFTKTFGLGLGYDYFRIDVTYDDSELRSDLEYQYHGIQAYGILRF